MTHDENCEAQAPGEDCCYVYRAEIERQAKSIEEAMTQLAFRDDEIEQLRQERDSAFQIWKEMHVATLNGFIEQHHNPLKAEIERLRGLLCEMLDGYCAENLTQQDIERRVRETLGDKP